MTDNAANILQAVEGVSQKVGRGWRSIPCFAHTLSLVVKKSLKKNFVLEPLVSKVQKIVTYFHSSCVATSKLKQLSSGTSKKLKQDV